MGRNYIKTFTASNKGSKSHNLPSGGSPGTPQSMTVLPNNVVAVFHNANNAGNFAHCRKYTKKGYVKNSDVGNHNLGHCNGATYCDENNTIYCTGYNNGRNMKKIVALDLSFKQKFTFTLPVAVTGIAYDKSVKKFYCTSGSHLYIFPLTAFRSSNRTKDYKHYNIKGATGQDVCGYRGIVYRVVFHDSYGDIDLYKHSSGKYIGSIKVSYSETESCGFDSSGNFIYLTAHQNRAIHWTNWKPTYSDGGGSSTSPGSGGGKGTAAQKFVQVAKKEVGTRETGNNHQKYGKWAGNDGDSWCAYFVAWCAYTAFGNNKRIPKRGMAHDVIHDMVNKCGGKWIKKSASAIKPGDLFVTDNNHNNLADHIGIVEKVSGSSVKTVEGNAGPNTDRVVNGSRSISSLWKVARPNWPDGVFDVEGGDEFVEGGELVLEVHPEQLYSSENYKYLEESQEESEEQKRLKAHQQELKEFLQNINVTSAVNNTQAIPDVSLSNIRGASNYKKPRTKVEGSVTGASLPSTINFVEAPYGKITLGGVTIGSYTNKKFPNYLNGINVRKTNGSLNEYTINLTHQIYPGDNPNYIDNLISKNGYNKIQIEYGDAEAGIAFRDIEALLINAKSSFDFFNNRINYTLSATSSSVMSAVNRRNYTSVTDKPSNIINKMLYDTGELLEYFPGMANKSFVNSNNLIPSNDEKVTIAAVSNTTPLNYMNKLVASMSNKDSIYYMSIDDNNRNESYFKIKQINTNFPTAYFPLVYEIDINYPDENSLAYNFSVDTDYSWPLAYEYAGGISTYNYDIDNAGKLISEKLTSNLKSITNVQGANVQDKNWWKNVTEFPVKATLEIKGLTTYTMLLNYIKVNVFYFGQKRNSSGIYIVTGQEDSLSGNGFKTKLSLLRVAGDNQHISVDGRVVT